MEFSCHQTSALNERGGSSPGSRATGPRTEKTLSSTTTPIYYRGLNNYLSYFGGGPYYIHSIMGPQTLF